MKKRLMFITICVLLLFCVAVGLHLLHENNKNHMQNVNSAEDKSLNETEEENSVLQQEDEDIFGEDNVIDLGNHVVAYRIANDEWIHTGYGACTSAFTGDYYIAIQSLNPHSVYSSDEEIIFVPDIYKNIIEIKLDENNALYIQYIDSISGKVEMVSVPIRFSSLTEDDVINIQSSSTHKRKLIIFGQIDLQSGDEAFPQLIWTEKFLYEDYIYEIAFERVSAMYSLGLETGGIFADYRLLVKDESGEVVSEQILADYPVEYEEVHWLVDLSGDSFIDIAFCTDCYFGKNSWSESLTLIWDPEVKKYIERDFPKSSDMRETYWARQLWNEELSSVISFVGRGEHDDLIMEMYSFLDGAWRRVRRLQVYYAEDEYTVDGELVSLGYIELIYSESGNVVEKRILEKNAEVDAIWFDEESVWSRYNVENLKLYPEFPEWEEIEANVNGIELLKYVSID